MAVTQASAPRRITVLGATGSVGRNALDLIARAPERFAVEALVAGRDVAALAAAARRVRAAVAVVADPAGHAELTAALAGSGIEAASGPAAVVEAGARPADLVVSAIVGFAGLEPTLAAIERGTAIALANKECLVAAGTVMTDAVRRHGARLIPVDSEHSAIFQVFETERASRVEKLILTASGGPFRTWTSERMAAATPAQAIAHPNWSMGAKISVDSATMMNKGLEMIEALHLFPVTPDQIEVVVHPQSVIQSLVAYVDGSVLAQLGAPDMRTPIAVALAWPDRMAAPVARLDLVKLARLDFEAPDPKRFPSLAVAREALRAGGGAPTLLNAANEVAVAAFLAGRIGFLDIASIAARTLETVPAGRPATLDDVRALDAEGRRRAEELIAKGASRRAG